MAAIFLLEDDALLAETLCDELQLHGHDVTHESSGDVSAELLFEHAFQLLLLDVNTPGISGFELLEALRSSGDTTPAIFITARASLHDLKTGFASGADDYLVKPFNMQELLIRIDAKLPSKRLSFANNKLQLDANSFTLINDTTPIALPPKEFAILRYFFTHTTHFCTKEAIEEALEEPISDATFRVYIKNLKKSIAPFATLQNRRGVGYRLETL